MAMPGIFRHMIKSGWCFAILRSRARHHDQYVRVSDCVCALYFKSCGTKMANLGKSLQRLTLRTIRRRRRCSPLKHHQYHQRQSKSTLFRRCARNITIREEVRRSRAVPMMLIITLEVTLEDRAGGRLCSPPSLRVRSRKQRQ